MTKRPTSRYTDPCIYATDGRSEVLAVIHPRCPDHATEGQTTVQVVEGLPDWVWEAA